MKLLQKFLSFFKHADSSAHQEQQPMQVMLTVEHLVVMVTVIILSVGCSFVVGYYWGKKEAVEQFTNQFTQDSFADRIYASLCSLYDPSGSAADSSEPENSDSTDSPIADSSIADSSIADSSIVDEDASDQDEQIKPVVQTVPMFCGALATYNNVNAAAALSKKLWKMHIAAKVVERKSVSMHTKNKNIGSRFVVISYPMFKKDLQRLIIRLKKQHIVSLVTIEGCVQ
jgi:hypothetical protein